jgi:hypothetical protein
MEIVASKPVLEPATSKIHRRRLVEIRRDSILEIECEMKTPDSVDHDLDVCSIPSKTKVPRESFASRPYDLPSVDHSIGGKR